MRAKDYMRSVYQAEQELRLIQRKRQHYIELATSLSVNLEALPGGNLTSSRTETAAIGLADLAEQLSVKAKKYSALVTEAQSMVDEIPQLKFRKLLTLKYLVGMSWKSVSDELDYDDEKSVYRAHKYALQELQKRIDYHGLT